MKEITVKAIPENLQLVLDLVNTELETIGCPVKKQLQIAIAVEEIYMNITNYAYYPDTGTVSICFDLRGEPPQVIIRFTDSGKPFDPLEKADPDITLSASERDIGGLGLYLVKKIIEKVTYEYRDGKNILTILDSLGDKI
ncbi:MAG: ATP-binding protein [Clostridiaceae bacterium]|nr:ATP-binding protein [Clostridiaceae bacterium]